MHRLPMVDFAYVDADHDAASECRNISQALLFVKPGGIIAGHDYIRGSRFDGVVLAVNLLFGEKNLTRYEDTSWLVRLK
jgi:hypothetical protein